ncbi:MAG: hypothetical protein ABSF60_13795 [Verrucomicrobiota bacterium]
MKIGLGDAGKRRMKMDNLRKIRIALGLCVVLGAGFISTYAADTPAQAAARVALERILNQPDNLPAQSPPQTNTLSKAVVEQPVASANNAIEPVPDKGVIPQPAPVAAPVAVVPVEFAPAAVSPAAIAPAAASPMRAVPAAAPALPFPMLWGLLLLLLLISFVIMSVLLLKLRQVKLMLLKHPNVAARTVATPPVAARPAAAPSGIQPPAPVATPKPAPAPAAAKHPVQRRKQVTPQNGVGNEVSLAKNGRETARLERKRVAHS